MRASDWHRHGHDGDPAYDSVILHVVDRDDAPIVRSNGETIPQMQMACSPDFYQRYSQLVDRADRDLPCSEAIASMSTLHMSTPKVEHNSFGDAVHLVLDEHPHKSQRAIFVSIQTDRKTSNPQMWVTYFVTSGSDDRRE